MRSPFFPLLSFPASFFHPSYKQDDSIPCEISSRKCNILFFLLLPLIFFSFFFCYFNRNAISKIDRCEIILICFVYYYHHVLYYFWIFEFCSNPISLYESFKKKKEKERKKIHLYLDKRTTRLDASPRIESDNSPLNREVSHPWL